MFDHSKRSKDRHRMVMLVMLILRPTDAAAGSYLITSSCFRDTTDPLS